MSQPFALPPKVKLEPALRSGRQFLEAHGKPSAALDARLLLTEATGLEYTAVLLAPGLELRPEDAYAFEGFINRRAAGEPVARILGRREFWGMNFQLNEETLVPRPETETLVETALAHLDAGPGRDGHIAVADLGTGTGCILAALLKECPSAQGVGADISPVALDMARRNLEALGLGDRARFILSSWCDALTGPFHLIVSNPPYIAENDMPRLMVEVREHDPARALSPGGDALSAYRAIIPAAHARLWEGGALAFEVGRGQARFVASLMEKAGFRGVGIRSDLSGIERAVIATK